MLCNLPNNETCNRPRTAPGCVQMKVNPVSIEVNRDTFCGSKNVQPSHQKKLGFWKSIFGDKKKRSKKYSKINQNSSFQNRCEENVGCQKCSAYCTTTEIQKSANCPTKCILPVNQRGVGCHLYFCIDSKRKKLPVKNKKAKNMQNEEIKTNMNHNGLNYNVSDDITCKANGNVTIFCDEPNYESKNSNEYDYVQIRSDPSPKTNTEVKPYIYSSSSKAIFHAQTNSAHSFSDYELKKGGKKDAKMGRQTFDNRGPKANGFVLETDESIIKQASKVEDNNIDWMKKNYRESSSDKKKNKNSILRKKSDGPPFMPFSENTVMAVNIRDTIESAKENKLTERPILFENSSDQSMQKNFSYTTSNSQRRRRSTAVSGLFAKNSLISVRKDRQSQIVNHVSLILEKLDGIENKINDLEKISKINEKNITMGISCTGKESRVAIKFDKPSEIEKKKYDDQTTKANVSSSFEKSNKIIKIKSQNERIYISTPAEVNVVKSKPIEIGQSRSKQLIYENAFQMDAHTIGSNSRTIKCDNPRIVISQCRKDDSRCVNPGCHNKWRRISQELQVSQQDVTNIKSFCKCKPDKCAK